jgi:hypothetical protein
MANARGRIVFGLLVALLGGALFLVTSAYVIDHGYLKIGAAIAGALAFPIVPALWHLIGERRRKARIAERKQPPKATLTGCDRYWLRFAVVAIAVLAPMIAKSGTGVLGAVRRHALWFLPDSPPSATGQLRRVPAEAELVVVIKDKTGTKPGTAVVAWGAGQAMIAADTLLDDGAPHAKKIDSINGMRGDVPWLPTKQLSEVKTDDGSFVIASDGWRSQVEGASAGPGAELATELDRAPASATFVAAFVPRTNVSDQDLDVAMIRHGVAWALVDDSSVTLDGRIEATDAAAATKLGAEITALFHAPHHLSESCQEAFAKAVDLVKLDVAGTVVAVHATLPSDLLRQFGPCVMLH